MTTLVAPIAPVEPAGTAPEDNVLELVVAERHIRLGRPGSPWHCPVALALTEAGHTNALVCGSHLYVGAHRYEHPESLEQWIQNFDQGLGVHPERWVLRSAGTATGATTPVA